MQVADDEDDGSEMLCDSEEFYDNDSECSMDDEEAPRPQKKGKKVLNNDPLYRGKILTMDLMKCVPDLR